MMRPVIEGRTVGMAGLSEEERGAVWGLFAGGGSPAEALAAAVRLTGASGERCLGAARALAALSSAERQTALGALGRPGGPPLDLEEVERRGAALLERALPGAPTEAAARAAAKPGLAREVGLRALALANGEG
jgi:hypothetical protein